MIKRSGIRVTAAQLFNFLPVELRKITARLQNSELASVVLKTVPRHKTSYWIHSAEQQLTQLTAELEEDTPDAIAVVLSKPCQTHQNVPTYLDVKSTQLTAITFSKNNFKNDPTLLCYKKVTIRQMASFYWRDT